jgi:class 3 adenylate cyclase
MGGANIMKRKIAAIFAADIAGYSKLVAEDEEETLRRMASYRSVIDDFIAKAGGRIFNTAGDAVLAEFPSAVEALRCAIDIQESLRTRNMAYATSRHMSYRIGITIGDVVERDGDLLGDGVNIAARLEGLAEVGGICISRAVHEQVVNKLSVQFADMGAQEVKNIPTPVHAYMVAMRREDGSFTTPQLRKKPVFAATMPRWTWPAVVALIAAVSISALASVYSSAINRPTSSGTSSSASTPTVPTQVESAAASPTQSSPSSSTPVKPEISALEREVSPPSVTTPALGEAKAKIVAEPPHESDIRRFDGTWTGAFVCESTSGLPGWKTALVGRIKNGNFHGQIGEEGKPGSETFDGMIKPDGSADISHVGYVGDSKRDPFHRPRGTEFRNSYVSKFDDSHGTGTRSDRDSCNVTFTKR